MLAGDQGHIRNDREEETMESECKADFCGFSYLNKAIKQNGIG